MFTNLVTYHIYKGSVPPFDAQAYQYLWAGNGLFVRGRTRFWEAILPVSATAVRGLPPLTALFQLRVPKIPCRLWATAVAHARQQTTSAGQLNESLYRFQATDTNCIRLIRPKQDVTPTHVTCYSNADSNTVLELHSHGTMAAFWSGVDNADEQGLCLYGVMGNLDRAEPSLLLRAGIYGYFLTVNPADVFADYHPLAEVPLFPRNPPRYPPLL